VVQHSINNLMHIKDDKKNMPTTVLHRKRERVKPASSSASRSDSSSDSSSDSTSDSSSENDSHQSDKDWSKDDAELLDAEPEESDKEESDKDESEKGKKNDEKQNLFIKTPKERTKYISKIHEFVVPRDLELAMFKGVKSFIEANKNYDFFERDLTQYLRKREEWFCYYSFLNSSKFTAGKKKAIKLFLNYLLGHVKETKTWILSPRLGKQRRKEYMKNGRRSKKPMYKDLLVSRRKIKLN
jgi:hypothetical protein